MAESPRKRLILIDGYSLLYRAFFATRYLSTSDGRPTNALFGFTSMLLNLIEKIQPDAVVVALDAPGKTFRHAEFAEYKGTRRETADELKVQLADSRELISALGIDQVECIGFEADDVVGTISKQAEENGYDTTVVTGDLDSLQLVDACVSVLTMKTGVTDTMTYDRAAVIERLGVGPELVPDFKAIKGDTSDNIPGVPGIGDKGAAELITTFGTIEQILERFDELPAKYQKKILGNEAQMKVSKWLATIVRNAPITYDFKPFSLTPEQMEAAIAFMDKLEFKGLVKRAPFVLARYQVGFSAAAPVAVEVGEETLEVELRPVNDLRNIREFVAGRPYGLYFASAPATDLFEEATRSAFVACGKQVRQVSEAIGIELLRLHPSQAAMHDAKPVYRRNPELGRTPGFDTMLAAYVLRSERSNYPLRDLLTGYLDLAPPTEPAQFAAGISLLQPVLAEKLEKESQRAILDEVELPLIPILTEMERLGICTDRSQLVEFSKTLAEEIGRLQQSIWQLAGHEFTIGSPQQLGRVLFEELSLPGAQKTKTGYATGVEVLADLAAEHEIVAQVLNWRELSKLKSTYADNLSNLIKEDGRIHTTYNQTGAATGRLSSNDPNLQNIPIRTELGRGIRRAFRAAEGYRLASLDYSQIELRVLAHMCEEPALVRAFNEGEDVHTVTAQEMFRAETVTKEQRRYAKMLNYAILYGVTEYGLAQQLGTGFSIAEAKELIRQYNEKFPSVKEFTQSIVAEARAKGYTTTLLGRRRHFPDIHAGRINERRYAERQAMNAPIQGTAADMMKLAMLKAKAALAGSSSRMLLNVHDELVFEVPVGDEAIIPALKTAMETALVLKVPTEVDAKIGLDWNEMTPI